MNYAQKLNHAFERLELAPYWKDSARAIREAEAYRDSVIDEARIHCRITGQSLEDLLDLPR